ncbi:hypothetical protein NQ315_013839 [Exocentrus adspersus]|uniref:UBA domain-containing protein n=1 Tax=Exocentrus adspersus TaxID=1586481 RepID=A0AAV8VHK5_9CUCU|nr:hypothetical protein NQ315_013839 [Exocentrus adspersus]
MSDTGFTTEEAARLLVSLGHADDRPGSPRASTANYETASPVRRRLRVTREEEATRRPGVRWASPEATSRAGFPLQYHSAGGVEPGQEKTFRPTEMGKDEEQ